MVLVLYWLRNLVLDLLRVLVLVHLLVFQPP